jgi:hypothetical protein
VQKPIAFSEIPKSTDPLQADRDQGDAKMAMREEAVRAENPMQQRRNAKIMDLMARDLLEQEGVAPAEGHGINHQNRQMPDGSRPSMPVRKTSALSFPDGGGMGPLPAPRPGDLNSSTKGQASVTRSEAARRMELCKNCPELIAMDRCRRCGCFMRVKTHLPGAQCPLQKW